jgi:hypothetical protein
VQGKWLCSLLLVASPAFAGGESVDAAKAFVHSLQLGETLQNGDVTVVPLERRGDAQDPGVSLNPGDASFEEPQFARHRYDVLVRNKAEQPLFLLGGTVLVGGSIDRLVRHDHLIAPGASAEIRTLPAASSSDVRKPAVPFTVSPVLAPLYLRSEADFNGSNSLVPSFVARWIDFRNEGDGRRSLAALVDSVKLREYVLGTKAQLNTLPASLAKPEIVGGVAALHGRVQSLTVYGTNELLAVGFPPAVKGATYAAAALAIRSRQVKVPLPGRGDPEQRKSLVRADAEKLLDMLRKARFREDEPNDGEVGASIQIQLMDGTRGRVRVLDGRVVHLILYPRDPFRQKLYGSAIDVPDEKAEPPAAPAGGSGGGGDELSSDERRFLERGWRLRRGGRRR